MEPGDETDGEPLTQSIRQTAKELNIGVNQCYEAAKRGEIPTIRIGKRILVLVKPLKRLLGEDAGQTLFPTSKE